MIALGVGDDLVQRRRSGLRSRAKGLLVDRRQAAGLVARARIVVDRGPERGDVFLPPMDRVDELLRHLRASGPPREQVLGAVDLRRLPEHDRSALADKQVARVPEPGVGGHAGPAVRASALQRHHQLRGGDRLADGSIGDRQQPNDRLDSALDRRGIPAVVLDRDHRGRVGGEVSMLDHVRRLVDLAAQTEDHVGGDVRMVHDAGERALELAQAARADVRAAPSLVRKADHPVDIREACEHAGACDLFDHGDRRRRGAVDRREHGDVVARPDPSVGPAEALKRPSLRGGHDLDRGVVRTKDVLAVERPRLEVVRMHVVTRIDGRVAKPITCP